MKKIFSTLALASTLLLTGCLVPEKFTAKIDVQPDAAYTFKYSGTAVNAMAAAQIQQAGALTAKEQDSLKKEADKFSKQADVKRAVHKGDGRYELEIESRKKPGESLRMFDIFSVSTDKNGVITLASTEINDKTKRELGEMGIKIDGTLEVKLPKNAEIISHNATSSPKFFGMFGAYSWKIGSADQRPMMKIKFKS